MEIIFTFIYKNTEDPDHTLVVAQKFCHFFNPLHAGYFVMICCRVLIFFQSELFKNNILGTLSVCQTVWIQIRTTLGPRKDILITFLFLGNCVIYLECAYY